MRLFPVLTPFSGVSCLWWYKHSYLKIKASRNDSNRLCVGLFMAVMQVPDRRQPIATAAKEVEAISRTSPRKAMPKTGKNAGAVHTAGKDHFRNVTKKVKSSSFLAASDSHKHPSSNQAHHHVSSFLHADIS